MRFEPIIALPSAWTSVMSQFCVHLFEGHVSLGDMEEMQVIAERWVAQHPGKRVEMVVIFPSDARMSSDERARMARMVKLGEKYRVASATVILAQGLVASVQRSILTGMMLVVPPPHPVKISAHIEEALTWLHPYVREVCGPVSFDALSTALQMHVATFLDRNRRVAL